MKGQREMDQGCIWGVSNVGERPLWLWLEPWAEEFDVAPRSTVILKSSDAGKGDALGLVEATADHLVLWINGGTVEVHIDGTLQCSGSATIPIPDGMTRQMLEIVFAGQPMARLGGATAPVGGSVSWWRRARRRLGF